MAVKKQWPVLGRSDANPNKRFCFYFLSNNETIINVDIVLDSGVIEAAAVNFKIVFVVDDIDLLCILRSICNSTT